MSALDVQIGGEHYKSAKIQPVQYIEANKLGFLEGCVVKRVTRHDKPTGKGRQDIEKAIHELQLLLELRYAPVETPMTFSERCAEIDAEVHAAAGRIRQEGETIIVSTPEQHAAIYAALGAVPNADGGTVSIHFGAQPFCAECEYPDDGTGTHYATCSKLTAPKEFVEQVEATFDELENPEPTPVCEHCGSREGAFHHADCHLMRVGKSMLAKQLSDLVVGQESAEFLGATAEVIAEDECAAIDPPTVCPGCGREEGRKHRRGCPALLPPTDAVEDPWAGAPEWAKCKAQDAVGDWCWYSHKPIDSGSGWMCDEADVDSTWDYACKGDPNPNWRDTLIKRP